MANIIFEFAETHRFYDNTFTEDIGIFAIHKNAIEVLDFIRKSEVKFDLTTYFIEAIKINNTRMMEYFCRYYKRKLDVNILICSITKAIQMNNLDILKWLDSNLDLSNSKMQIHFALAADLKHYAICEWLFRNAFPLPSDVKCINIHDPKVQDIIKPENWWYDR